MQALMSSAMIITITGTIYLIIMKQSDALK